MSETPEELQMRIAILCDINREPTERERLEQNYGQVWDTQELQQDFDVLGFRAPFVIVTRKADGVQGSLTFQHNPRYYFDFNPR